jgi:hypothetical protein
MKAIAVVVSDPTARPATIRPQDPRKMAIARSLERPGVATHRQPRPFLGTHAFLAPPEEADE